MVLLAISVCTGQESRPLLIIYTPKAPSFGAKLQSLLEADGRMDAEIHVLGTPEVFNLMMHYPGVKAAVVALNTDVNHDIGLTLERFFSRGGGLVGLGFAGAEQATGPASERVFPIFGNRYESGEFDRVARTFKLTHLKEEEDEISEGVADFTVFDGKLILSADPFTKEYVPRAPESGEYKVLFRDSTMGAPSLVKYVEKGTSVTFASFAGEDGEGGYGYFGRYADTIEFRTLFTNAVYWVWSNEHKYDDAMEHAAGYQQRQDEIEDIRERAEDARQKEDTSRLLQIVLTVCLAAIGLLAVYWITFLKAPKT